MNWIKIESEASLPQTTGSVRCWVTINGKVYAAKYHCRHFIIRAEFCLYEWHFASHYIPLEKPSAPNEN